MLNGVMFNNNYPIIEKSNELYNRALELIPSTTQTIAKGPSQYVNGIAPKYLIKGEGSHVWDADGNEYIDFNMGIGPISLGYNYRKINEAIINQLKDGITFSLMHPLEVEVAELISEIIPNAEMVKYSKTGADVTSAAIRLARAFTGKDKVLTCGYHGWHDWYANILPPNKGIPNVVSDLTHTFNYNDIDSLKNSIDDNTAAVILEPVVFEAPKNNFLRDVYELCREKNVVLIFDEMWTGFRISLGGAQEYFDIKPDLATYSKAIANGMPLSVLTGRKEIMKLAENDIFFYTTFGGEALSLAAAKATIEEMWNKNVINYLNVQGKKIKDGFNALCELFDLEFITATGYNWRSLIKINDTYGDPLIIKSYIQQEMIKRGILWSGFHNMSYSHSDKDINYTLSVYEDVLKNLKDVISTGNMKDKILGIPVQPVFRKIDNFNVKPVNK
ncbi:MAG: aminotransferase class III-fold pyridoxal phosphate-dependent enzyme [Ignavibacteriales bacterium]|nr:aminotransferase class III-fold pyridoxal phosphate-dependent enzyme [Ignavibacteriales bacterium]